MVKTPRNSFLCCLFLLVISGCSSNSDNSTYYQKYNVNQLANYSFYPRDAKFTDWQSLSFVTRSSIEFAIENGMSKHKVPYVEPEDADFIITYFLMNQTGAALAKYNTGVNFCSYCLRSPQSGNSADKERVKMGSLIIDFIDTKTKQTVWRSSYQVDVSDKDNSRDIQDKIQRAIDVMLKPLAIKK